MAWKIPNPASLTDLAERTRWLSLQDFLKHPSFDTGVDLGSSADAEPTNDPTTGAITPADTSQVDTTTLTELVHVDLQSDDWDGTTVEADDATAGWRIQLNGAAGFLNVIVQGTVIGSTIIGGIFKTAVSGPRIEIDSALDNVIRFFSGSVDEQTAANITSTASGINAGPALTIQGARHVDTPTSFLVPTFDMGDSGDVFGVDGLGRYLTAYGAFLIELDADGQLQLNSDIDAHLVGGNGGSSTSTTLVEAAYGDVVIDAPNGAVLVDDVPLAIIHQAGSQSVTSTAGTWTTATSFTTDKAQGGMTATTSAITVPRAGWYRVTARADYGSGAAGALGLGLLDFGGTDVSLQAYNRQVNTRSDSLSGTALLKATAAGQTVSARRYQQTGASLNIKVFELSVQYVGAA